MMFHTTQSLAPVEAPTVALERKRKSLADTVSQVACARGEADTATGAGRRARTLGLKFIRIDESCSGGLLMLSRWAAAWQMHKGTRVGARLSKLVVSNDHVHDRSKSAASIAVHNALSAPICRTRTAQCQWFLGQKRIQVVGLCSRRALTFKWTQALAL